MTRSKVAYRQSNRRAASDRLIRPASSSAGALGRFLGREGGIRDVRPGSSNAFDAAWTLLLARGADASDHGLTLIEQALPEDTSMATLPHGIVYRLHLAATATYRSVIVCLKSAETSVGACALLRGLLEAWSHLAFIGDDAEGGDVRCRALRYELGAAREWATGANALPARDRERWSTQAQTRVADLEEAWRELACTGPYRTRKHVEPTLRQLAKQPKMEWIPGVWRATSAALHMYGADFALRDRGDGSSDVVWAPPAYRAGWLMYAASSYAYLTLTAAHILGVEALTATHFGEEVRRVVVAAAQRAAQETRSNSAPWNEPYSGSGPSDGISVQQPQ